MDTIVANNVVNLSVSYIGMDPNEKRRTSGDILAGIEMTNTRSISVNYYEMHSKIT
ncbi:MAG: hypothetical protein IPN88_15885 [Bacteroidetes bacterium]|nr:hypothetical protein [Bacteroidota bacterium]